MPEPTVQFLLSVRFRANSEQQAMEFANRVADYARQQAAVAGTGDIDAHVDEDVLCADDGGQRTATEKMPLHESWETLGFDGVEVD